MSVLKPIEMTRKKRERINEFADLTRAKPAAHTDDGILRWREKMNRATTSVGCDEMQSSHKIEHFVYFGETDESPDTVNFYFQHNKKSWPSNPFDTNLV